MRLLARAMAERAVVGVAVAVSAAITDDPDVGLPALIDQAIAHLEPGLTL